MGISRVYSLLAERKMLIFDTCAGLRDELGSYRRELDQNGQPTEKIANKSDYHLLDSLRYAVQCVTDRAWALA